MARQTVQLDEDKLLGRLERLEKLIAEGGRRRGGGLGTALRAFALGALAGGGVALLYAPRAGEQTRRQLLRRGAKMKDQASELAGQARQQAGAVQDRAQRGLEQARGAAQPLLAAAGDAAERVRASAAGGGEAVPPPSPGPLASSLVAWGGRAEPRGDACPPGYPIKGNRSSSGEWIYHPPGSRAYEQTIPEECFATERDAEAAGYRRAQA